MDAIVGWLSTIFHSVITWLTDLFKEFIKLVTTWWGLMLIVAGLAYSAFTDAVGAINTIVTGISGLADSSGSLAPGGTFSFLLSVGNTFTPLDELMQYGAAYLVMMGVFGLYKLLKSWLPEIFGWSVGQGSGT